MRRLLLAAALFAASPAFGQGFAVRATPGPIIGTPFACQVSGATSTTSCQASPGAGLSLYVTDIWLSNGSATASAINLIYANAGACTGSPTDVTPAITLSSNAGAGAWTQFSFTTPLKLPADKALCCKTAGTTAFSCLVVGYYGS